jgi:hypothetical protein
MSLVLSMLTETDDSKQNDKPLGSSAVKKNQLAIVSLSGSIAPLIQSARTITKDVASYWSEVVLTFVQFLLFYFGC